MSWLVSVVIAKCDVIYVTAPAVSAIASTIVSHGKRSAAATMLATERSIMRAQARRVRAGKENDD